MREEVWKRKAGFLSPLVFYGQVETQIKHVAWQ